MDKPPLDGWAMVICNPISGAGHGLRILKSVRRTLDRAGVTYSHEVSGARGEVAQIARSAVLAGCSTVIVIGGDGTFFEAVNGVVGPIDPESAGHPDSLPTVAIGLV